MTLGNQTTLRPLFPILLACLSLANLKLAHADTVVCSDFRHVDEKTAMIMAEYLDARLPVQDWSLEAATNPVVSAFVFVEETPSTYVMNCAQGLEEFGFFGAVQIVNGTSKKLGNFREIYPLKTMVEIHESSARLSIDGLAVNVHASNLSEPFKSIRALEHIFYLPDGICSQEEKCFNFVYRRLKED